NKILYERVYYLNGNQPDSFYRFSNDPSSAKFSLSFTEVGQNNGNYVPDFNGANGKVFRFVQPQNGARSGSYEPVLILIAPKKQQLISVGTDYQLNKGNNLKTELGLSNYDVNTYSSKDGGDDVGLAAKIQYSNVAVLNKLKGVELTSTFDYEHVSQKFKPLERLRYVEFSREWGLPLLVQPATEDILRAGTRLKLKANHSLGYQFMSYRRSDQYKGYQNSLQHLASFGGWNVNNNIAITSFNTATDKGSFLRPVVDISKQLKRLSNVQLGFRYALEKNEVRNKRSDSLTALSFSFDTYTAYLKSNDKKKNRYGISFFTRADKYPVQKEMTKGDRSYNINFNAEVLKSERHQVLFTTTYRKLKVYNKTISREKDDKTLLGRTEYLVNEWKGLLRGSVLYELGTGQEQKRDFAYLEVPAGQGQYAWIDYDSSRTQELNEFEVAQFQDQARFIRVFVPSNQFLKANYNTLNYSFTFNPREIFGKATKGLGKFVSRFNYQTSMQKTKKSASNEEVEFNPFKYSLLDTALITQNTSFLNTLSFNRYSTHWGLDVSNLQTGGKNLLTYGYESRKAKDWIGKLRYNIGSSLTLNLNGKKGVNALYTPNANFQNRNYEIDLVNAEPQIVFIRGTVFRVQSGYRIEKKRNADQYGGQEAISNALNLESKYNVFQNSSINGRFTYNAIDYKDKASNNVANTTVSYIMLDGLLPGNNFLWSLDLTKRLLNNVELNFQYEGRKPGEKRTIHTGRASLRAFF
ncbi:MAG TPA: hypothetical protein VM935_12995, partial [Chitinophagaceae bacterium]|nr:hypothetical protein [Chitinophagaceae bacterium]